MIRSIQFRIFLPSLCMGVLLLGCSKRREVVHYDYVEPAHTCSVGCHDHYYVDRNVIYVTGHRHSNNCGHYWDGGCWRKNRAARLNPRPYSSGRIHIDDRHGHYKRPVPNRRDRYENRDRHQDRNNDRRYDNRRDRDQRRDRNDRVRNSDRARNVEPRTRPQKIHQSTIQKRASDQDDDDRSMGRKRSGDR